MPGDGKDANDALVAALANPRKPMELETVPEPVVEEAPKTVIPAESGADEAADAGDDKSPEGQSTDGKADDVTYLKSRLGKQSNELGELRKQVTELTSILEAQGKPKAEPGPSLADTEKARIAETYSPEFGDHLQAYVKAALAPLQARILIQDLQTKYADFNDMVPEMDKVLGERPALANIVKQDLSSLEDVYMLAKARKGVSVLDSDRKRVAAETEQKEREKKAAVSERPSKAASKAEPEASPTEINQAWAHQIATMRNPNRAVS